MEHGGGREEAGRGSAAAQRRGSPEEWQPLQPPKSFPSPGSAAGRSWGDKKGRRGQLREWLKLFGHSGSAPSPLLTLYMSLEKLLRCGRHRNVEGPATGAASIGGSSFLCRCQQRKAGRSSPLRNVCVFQDVSEVHTSQKWYIRAQKLE